MRAVILLLLLASLAHGCTTARSTDTSRAATEQLLISNAVDRALDKVDFRPFRGRAVYLEEKYIDCVDKNYVIASLRHRLLAAGATLVPAADGAEIVIEARSGAVGTTSSESFVGTPEVVLPGMLTIPEIRLMTRTRQEGTAKLGLVAYDARTGNVLGPGGHSLAQSDDNHWFVAGVGPWRSGSLKADLTRSTSGRAAWSGPTLPHYVAFAAPPVDDLEPHRIQMTGVDELEAAPAGAPAAPLPDAP